VSTNDKLIELAERRVALRARIEEQRQAVGAQAARFRPALGLVDSGLHVVDYLRRNPAPLVAALTLAVVLRPRRLFTWSRRAWLGWKLWTRLRQHFDSVLAR
jgi:hypothetical protein